VAAVSSVAARDVSVAMSPSRLMMTVGYLVAAAVVILDQATKHLAELQLVVGRPVAWLSDGIGWQLTYNDGGAFGIGAPSWFFLVVTVVVTVIVVRNLPRAPRLTTAWSYGLLLAGALGNALDRVFRTGDPGDPRFFHGHVVDFVAWGSFPRFNLADVAINVGFALLVLDLLRHGESDAA
jgi:signal peptidase II